MNIQLTPGRSSMLWQRHSQTKHGVPLVAIAAYALMSIAALPVRAANEPIAIAEIKHEGPIDFEAEVLPILKKNCIACHNHASKKGDLILETPQTILAGGSSGSAVEPGQ